MNYLNGKRMIKYKHKKTNIIVNTERFHRNKADGFIDQRPYIVSTTNGLEIILASPKDTIIYYETKDRIFKTIIPTKELEKNFIKLEGING